jgi:hypothetical protein
MIGLPKIDARLAYTNQFGNFRNRKATLDASVTKKTREIWLPWQRDHPRFKSAAYLMALTRVRKARSINPHKGIPAMRLNEFANPKDYMLSTTYMAKFLKQTKRVWCDVGIDATAPFVLRLVNEPGGVRQMLAGRAHRISQQPIRGR